MGPGRQRLQFSSYSFDPTTGELSRYGIRLRLETQPARVLELLIAAQGQVVPRSDLIAALWPGEVEGNFDHRLDKAVTKLRASLNDDPAKPRYIETLKGRGYRFVEIVTQNPGDITPFGSAEAAAEQPEIIESPDKQSNQSSTHTLQVPHPEPHRRFPGFQWIAVVAMAAVILGLAVRPLASRFDRRPAVRPPDHQPILLILGFRDVSSSSEDVWISHSVAEWLSTELDAGADVQLIHGENNPQLRARSSGKGCRELPQSVQETARRAFGADFVVYGDYSETADVASGDRWRLNVCLENVQSKNTPESMMVVGTKGDIAQLVSNAGELIRSKLGLKQLSTQSLGYLTATLPSNLAAARLYAEGTSALEHFEPEEASALLTQAIQFEPKYAPAHAVLAAAWAALGYQLRSRQEALLARDLAKTLSPTQQLDYEGLADDATDNWPAAIEIYNRLVQRYPESIDYALKLANAQTSSVNAQAALDTLRVLRSRNPAARKDPRVDLAEAAANSVLSNFKGQLSASINAESLAEARGAELVIGDARMEQANADDMLGNWTDAARLWRMAGQGYESVGDRAGMADALNHQAVMSWKKGDAPNARKLFEESINLSRETGDNVNLAYALSHLGIVRMAVDRAPGGEMPEAVKMFREAISVYHAIGNTAEEGYVLSLLGDEAMQRTQFEEARKFYSEAMTLSQAANDKSRVAGRLLDLGIVAEAEGHNQEAIQLDTQSSQAYEKLGQKDHAAIANSRLGIALFRSGRVRESEQMLEDSLTVMRAFGRRNQVREELADLTRVELVQNPVKAEIVAREDLHMENELLLEPYCCSISYVFIAEAKLAQGKLQDAKEEIRHAFAADKVIPAEGLPEWLLARGDVKVGDQDYSGADADFKQALRMVHSRGDRYLELDSRLQLAELHICQKRPSATRELDKVKHDADQLGYGIFDLKIDSFLTSHRPAS